MKSILNVSNPWELNTLFLQPTRWCNLSCKGCYVKEHSGGENGHHLNSWQWIELFRHFYSNLDIGLGYKAWANQITLAVDNLSLDDFKSREMLNIFKGILGLIVDKNFFLKKNFPEFHITCHTPKTLREYTYNNKTDWITRKHTMSILKNIDMISFSEIPEHEFDFVKEVAVQTSVNYNHLIPSNVTSLTIDSYIDKIAKIGEIVNHIYLVIFKRPVGSPTNDLIKLGDRSRMMSDIKVINTLMERLPESVRAKINKDGCLQDVSKHARTGFGCSSNVSRVQVWPDGSVTGCAYAFGADKPKARSIKAILENIRTCRKEYDFKSSCHLPEVYDSICQ